MFNRNVKKITNRLIFSNVTLFIKFTLSTGKNKILRYCIRYKVLHLLPFMKYFSSHVLLRYNLALANSYSYSNISLILVIVTTNFLTDEMLAIRDNNNFFFIYIVL